MEKEIEIDGRKFKIRELLAIELDDIDFTNSKEALRKQVKLSTGLSDEDYNKLTVKERLSIVNAINEVNGLKDFQKPAN